MRESILKQIEHTREKMIQSALDHGFKDVNTIRLSKRLDRLLNLYQFKNLHQNNIKLRIVKN